MGRPRSDCSKWSSREAYNDYMREYMRLYRARHGAISQRESREPRNMQAPLPKGIAGSHRDLTGEVMGDPPIGRSALDLRGRS